MAEEFTKIDKRIDFFNKAFLDGSGTSNEQIQQVNYFIFSAVVTVSSAFGNVSVRVEPNVDIIVVKINLRWLARRKLKWLRLHNFMEWQREQWRLEAIEKCKEFVPNGFRLWLYYERDKNGRLC